jgi:hypothetical protein
MPGMLRKSTVFVPRYQKMLWGGRRGRGNFVAYINRWSAAMPQPNDLSKSLVALDHNTTIIAVVELSQSSWLTAMELLTAEILAIFEILPKLSALSQQLRPKKNPAPRPGLFSRIRQFQQHLAVARLG